MRMDRYHTNKNTVNKRKLKRIWREARPACTLILSVLIVFVVSRYAVNYVVENFIEPVDRNDATPIEVTIPASSSASSIARILYGACGAENEGLINNTAVFKVYVDFVGKANSLKAGTYVLSKNMSVKQMVDVICEGNPPKQTIKFTIPEGYSIRDIAGVLVEKGLIPGEDALYSICRSGGSFRNFAFIDSVASGNTAASRDYVLEGYLFPDTYEVYADSSVESILTRMLNRFNEIFTEAYAARAQELDMSVDQVVTLASLIEREAQAKDDFARVSAVFHNRLRQKMQLQSCASLSYVLKVNKYTFTESELATESAYNTYKHSGLPVGAVGNPGKAAIEAALYPNEEYLGEDGYLFFCNGNIQESNELVFSKNYEEHQKNVEKYQQYWS